MVLVSHKKIFSCLQGLFLNPELSLRSTHIIGKGCLTFRSEKSKFIENRLIKFAGDYEVIHDNYIEIFKTYFNQEDEKDNKTKFIENLKQCPDITPFEILELVSGYNLKVDAHAMCTLLLRRSHSLVNIDREVVQNYFLKALLEPPPTPSSVETEKIIIKPKSEKFVEEIPYEEMNEIEKNQKREQFCIKLAEFLRNIRK